VILSPGSALRPPLVELKQAALPSPNSKLSTLEEAEREQIVRAIRASNWVHRRAKRRRSTTWDETDDLAYRIRKLNISVSSAVIRGHFSAGRWRHPLS